MSCRKTSVAGKHSVYIANVGRLIARWKKGLIYNNCPPAFIWGTFMSSIWLYCCCCVIFYIIANFKKSSNLELCKYTFWSSKLLFKSCKFPVLKSWRIKLIIIKLEQKQHKTIYYSRQFTSPQKPIHQGEIQEPFSVSQVQTGRAQDEKLERVM